MNARDSARRRLRFRLDNALTRGAPPVVALLGLLTMLLIVGCAVIIVVGGIANSDGETQSFFEAGWASLMRTLDPGTMGGDQGWTFRIVSLGATLGGIFVVSTLIGVITAAIESRLAELRSGRGPVVLSGHTVILGWSQGLDVLLAELAEANANQHRPSVVVLAPLDAHDMRSIVEAGRASMGHQRVICRTGDAADIRDLALVSTEQARSVIVVHDDGIEADAEAVRVSLAVINGLPGYRGRVITQISNRSLAAALGVATNDRAIAVTSREVIAKVTAQACRFPGMSAVYEELLDFDGDEIYVQHEPRLVGATFAQIVLSYHDSMPIGIQRSDRSIELCPAWDRELGPDESVVAVSRDDDTVVMTRRAEPVVIGSSSGSMIQPPPIHLLVIGWNEFAHDLLVALDAFLPPASTITVCSPSLDTSLLPDMSHEVVVVVDDIDQISGLRRLANLRSFDNALLLCSRTSSAAEDDSHILLRLVILRRVLSEEGCPSADATIITELRDVADIAIAGQAGDEFLVSERITSLLLAQLSENPDLLQVFQALFEPSEVDLVMVPSSRLTRSSSTTFGDLVRDAMPYGLVIGVSDEHGMRLNLHRSTSVEVGEGVQAIVLVRSSP